MDTTRIVLIDAFEMTMLTLPFNGLHSLYKDKLGGFLVIQLILN